MRSGKYLEEIWRQVPVDYYQKGVENNIFQKIWHFRKLKFVTDSIRHIGSNPKVILDAGAASGWFLSEVARFFPKSECVGIDIYEDAIHYGKKKYNNLKLSRGDIHKIPFKVNTFDVVICCEVLEHVKDPKKALKEIKRVLKPGGIAVIEIDTGNILFKLVWFWWTTVRHGVWRDSHIHLFNTKILEDLFQESGFQIEKKNIFNLTMAVVYTLKPKYTFPAISCF